MPVKTGFHFPNFVQGIFGFSIRWDYLLEILVFSNEEAPRSFYKRKRTKGYIKRNTYSMGRKPHLGSGMQSNFGSTKKICCETGKSR